MTDKVKEQISNVKENLDTLETKLEEKSSILITREERWKKLDEESEYIKSYQNSVVKFNVSGQMYATRQDTLLRIKDTLFYKLVLSKKFDLSKEIFIDRSNNLFSHIMGYLRTGKINYSRFSSEELEELRVEADYYELVDITQYLDERLKEPILVNFEFKGPYTYSGQTAGTNKLEDVTDKNLNTGICSSSPGWILFELNHEFEISQIEIGGYRGKTNIWGPENGANGTIKVSKDKSNWQVVGTIPSGFGNSIVTVNLNKQVGKYIRFEHTSFVGIGYLKIIKK